MSTPNKPTRITNELAKERNRAAAERTLTSWIQNCLTIIGFGIVFEQIFTALTRAFPGNSPAINLRLAHLIGSMAIAIGIFLLVLAILGYLMDLKSSDKEDSLYRSTCSFNPIVVGSVILFGLIALVVLLLKSL